MQGISRSADVVQKECIMLTKSQESPGRFVKNANIQDRSDSDMPAIVDEYCQF